ncbi:MAG: hypothetical protein PHO32_04515 [Candidatus Cloacimonetes bacterium]|nr:hypothetical protein [Candidatus Cloacimonadota bacterium]
MSKLQDWVINPTLQQDEILCYEAKRFCLADDLQIITVQKYNYPRIQVAEYMIKAAYMKEKFSLGYVSAILEKWVNKNCDTKQNRITETGSK